MFKRPPSPQGHWLMGNVAAFQADPPGFLLQTAQTQGDVSCFRLGPAYIYLVNHPDYIHQIFVEETDNFYKSSFAKRSLGKLLGNGLVLSDGSFWKRQRKLAQPAFHHKRIAAYASAMVENTIDAINQWEDGAAYRIDLEMAQLALTIMSKTIFNLDSLEGTNEATAAISTLQGVLAKKLLSAILIPEWLPTSTNRIANQSIAKLDKIIYSIINERRQSGVDKGDIVSMLLLARDEETGEQMSDQQLRDELLTLFIAGHETTANLLTWTWYLISQHPEVEAKLQAELETVLNGRTPTFQDLAALKYNEMVIKEVLRLYPPAWIIVRQPVEDATVGGYVIKKGTTVFVSPYAIQHDPRYYPEPERFNPERFAPGYEEKIPNYAYIPFSGGQRICIGNSLAMMEARLIVATIMQRFRLSYETEYPVKSKALLTLVPDGGIIMRASSRVSALADQTKI